MLRRRTLLALATGMLGSLVLAAGGVRAGAPSEATPRAPERMTVALPGEHGARFAGWYAAIDRGDFVDQGLDVALLAGTGDRNPVVDLLQDRADVAVASMDEARAISTPEERIVNVAQLLQSPDSVLICRTTDRMLDPSDLRAAVIAVGDRRPLVEELLAVMFPDGHDAEFVVPEGGIGALTSGTADCQWGSMSDEYWRAEAAGLHPFAVHPDRFGVVDIDDGLYVRERRLQDPAFRGRLAGLLVGLEAGWRFARDQQDAAVLLAVRRSPGADPDHQRRQLEAVLPLLGDDFGWFDVGRYESIDGHGVPTLPAALRDRLWTHQIYDAAAARSGDDPYVTRVTRHYLDVIQRSPWYRWLVGFGTAAAAAAGALLGVRLGYRFWGRLVLATITALGGGLIRDITLGGDRYPSYLVHDPTDLFVVASVAVAVTLARYVADEMHGLARLHRAADVADVAGFSVLAVHGALIALVSGATVVWAPISAALTVAGGGILTDVVARREHRSFYGAVYEEVAVVAAVCLLAGLAVANRFEHRPQLVLGAVAAALALTVGLRVAAATSRLRYPQLRRRRAGDAAAVTP